MYSAEEKLIAFYEWHDEYEYEYDEYECEYEYDDCTSMSS